jgi:hypothetical protein
VEFRSYWLTDWCFFHFETGASWIIVLRRTRRLPSKWSKTRMRYLTLRATAIGTVVGLLAMAFVACSKQPMEQSSVARNIETQSPGVKPFTSEELNRRTIERRAVDAAIWGMPIVNFDAMRQAFFRDANATYGTSRFGLGPGVGNSNA